MGRGCAAERDSIGSKGHQWTPFEGERLALAAPRAVRSGRGAHATGRRPCWRPSAIGSASTLPCAVAAFGLRRSAASGHRRDAIAMESWAKERLGSCGYAPTRHGDERGEHVSLFGAGCPQIVAAAHRLEGPARSAPHCAHSDPCISPQARIDRPADKRRASHPLPQAAFKRHSSAVPPCAARRTRTAGSVRTVGLPPWRLSPRPFRP